MIKTAPRSTWIDESLIDHNLLKNYIANEHINHSSISITGAGLLVGQGGDLTASRVFTLNNIDIDHDQLTNTHNLTTDIDHNQILNNHNLTTDIDHDTILNNHNLTTDIDHDTLTNTHNLTTDIDHDQILNNHNLTTDIDHDQLTNAVGLTYQHSGIDNHIDNVTEDHTQYPLLDGSRALTADWNVGSFKITAEEFSGWGIVPVGGVVAWLKSFTNTPALPDGSVECNGQVLSDSDSVYNGQTIPNLNGSGGTKRFLRGATTSGSVGGTSTHRHRIPNASTNFIAGSETTPGAVSIAISQLVSATFYTNYYSTLPHYYQVVWVMRVK